MSGNIRYIRQDVGGRYEAGQCHSGHPGERVPTRYGYKRVVNYISIVCRDVRYSTLCVLPERKHVFSLLNKVHSLKAYETDFYHFSFV